jgi:hypothetical protein
MEQSPSWETGSHSASQEIPILVLKPKVHYHVHSSLRKKQEGAEIYMMS